MMLLLRLALTPLLILAASLAGRRWGETVGGWMVGLPMTSGPVALILALGQGPEFARQAAAGTLAGTAGQAAFSVAYAWTAEWGWFPALAAGACGFFACGLVLQPFALPHFALFAVAVAALSLGLAVTRKLANRPVAAAGAVPAWDLPARMAIGAAVVVTVTSFASALGPRLSGLVTTFPVIATVLASFAHHGQGPAAAQRVIRGLMAGLYGFACFFLALGLLLTRAPIPVAFAVACLASVTVQGGALVLMRRRARTS